MHNDETEVLWITLEAISRSSSWLWTEADKDRQLDIFVAVRAYVGLDTSGARGQLIRQRCPTFAAEYRALCGREIDAEVGSKDPALVQPGVALSELARAYRIEAAPDREAEAVKLMT